MKATLIKLEADGSWPAGKLKEVAAAVNDCRIVVFPTDTVYGIGSTGLVKAAARKIYQIKKRPTIKPLPILVHSTEEAKKWVQWTPGAELLAKTYWPGPLTLILRMTHQGKMLTFGEYQTLAIRVPNHPALLELIKESGVPWVQSSANISGEAAAVDVDEVIGSLGDEVDYIIDGGKASGRESTLVDATAARPIVLREGAIPAQDVQALFTEGEKVRSEKGEK